ncbi:MAG: hypothetical protein P1V36_02365 [Planctomycetota bacterium]|nr:hypothetical protein [Planctomycetota bacterium]
MSVPTPHTPPPEDRPDALADNLARTPLADGEHAPSEALRARIEGLRVDPSQAGGERETPPPPCYNDPTSRGDDVKRPPQTHRQAGPPVDRGASMQLQACTNCGAQFDVSAFTPGQQFSCGACGTVLTAPGGAPAAPAAPARTPGGAPPPPRGKAPGGKPPARRGAPSRGRAPTGKAPTGKAPTSKAPKGKAPGGRTPGGRAPSKGAPGRKRGPGKAVTGGPAAPARGPQDQPVQRAGQEAAPKGPARSKAPAGRKRAPARGDDGGDAGAPRGRREARPAAGPNKGLLIGVGAVVLLVVVGLVAFGGDGGTKGKTGGGTETADGGTDAKKADVPVVPSESVQDVMGEYATERPTTLRGFKGFINRLKALEDEKAKKALRGVYEDFIGGPGRDDQEARKYLGYREFPHEIPEDIANREYPYLKAVTAAYNHHWYGPDEDAEYEIAMRAWKKTQKHYEQLINDHHFQAADSIRANIAKDKFFKDYNYAARWADPYLICYASTDRLSEYDLLSIEDKDERRLKMKELAKKREVFERVLDEKALIFTQLYKEFYNRYKDSLSLKPLMDEYGGRPDYPIGVRSFQNGSPMVVWIFDSKKAFNEYHDKVSGEAIPHNVAGYFSPRTTYVYLYDEGGADGKGGNRVFEINKNVHEGTHQLEFWFTRQRNRWRKPRPGQDWFGEGIAEFVGSVKMEQDGSLAFLGINVPRLQSMQRAAKQFEGQGQKYRKFPIERLVSFNSYGEVQAWGATEWTLNPNLVLLMFYEQSWAFTYFLNTYENGKYKERFEKFFDLVLHRETGVSKGAAAFKEAFRIRDEDDWEDLNDEFHEYLDDVIMKMNANKFDYVPPARGSIKGPGRDDE